MSLVANLVHVIKSHKLDVNHVCFSDKTLATCSGDKTVRLWNLVDYTEHPNSPLCAHTYYVNCCEFSPFGSLLASCSTDGKIILWNCRTGEKTAVLQHPGEVAVRTCQFSPNSSMLATGGDDETVCLWDVASKKLVRVLKGHESMVPCVTFSPDSQYLISGCTAGDLFAWDAIYGHGKMLTLVTAAHDLGVTCCAFSPTFGSAGTIDAAVPTVHFLLATGGNDHAVKMWSFKALPGSSEVSIKLSDTLLGHSADVMSCVFSNNGHLLASSSLDKAVRIWDPVKGECLHTVIGHKGYITCCAFSADSTLLASGSLDKTVMIWEITSQVTVADLVTVDDVQVTVNKKVSAWTVEEVAKWITELGLAQYEDVFKRNAVDGTELLTLTHETLERNLAIEALGHRNKILRAIQHAETQPSTKTKVPDSEQDTPDEYLCPITRELMKEPVLAADGYTYERSAITAWLNSGKTCSPMTNAVMANTSLMPNRSLKMLIQRHIHR